MIKKIICLISICFSFVGMAYAENYAVLISAGKAYTDYTALNSEYWYDLYLTYEYLLGYENYDSTNVYVFYGDGVDYNSDIPRFQPSFNNWGTITDYDNSYYTMYNVLSSLDNIITDEDNLLFYWVVGHGEIDLISLNPDTYYAYIENRNDRVSKSRVKDLVDCINHYNKRKIIWMTCHSGCMGEASNNLNNEKTVLITSVPVEELSAAMKDIFQSTYHSAFNYAMYCIVTGHYPHDVLDVEVPSHFRTVMGYLTRTSNYVERYYDDSILSLYEIKDLVGRFRSVFPYISYWDYNPQLYGSDLAEKIFFWEEKTIEDITLSRSESYWLDQLELKNVSIANNTNVDLDIEVDDHFSIESNILIPVGSSLLVK